MAGKTTNLQLQKIDDTDYAGNFPTIYNNNLDLIDGLKSNVDAITGKAWNVVSNIDDLKNIIEVIEDEHNSTKILRINNNLRISSCTYDKNKKIYYYIKDLCIDKCTVKGNLSDKICVTSNLKAIELNNYAMVLITTDRPNVSIGSMIDITVMLKGNFSIALYKNLTSSINGADLVTSLPMFPYDNTTFKRYLMIEYQDS